MRFFLVVHRDPSFLTRSAASVCRPDIPPCGAQPTHQRTKLRVTESERAKYVIIFLPTEVVPTVALDMEPFDEALDRRIWSLAATRLQWQKRISETRRRLPLEIETMILELMEEQKAAEAEETASLQEEIGFDQVEGDMGQSTMLTLSRSVSLTMV